MGYAAQTERFPSQQSGPSSLGVGTINNAVCGCMSLLASCHATCYTWCVCHLCYLLNLGSLESWKRDGRRGVWLSIPLMQSDLISVAAEVCLLDYVTFT